MNSRKEEVEIFLQDTRDALKLIDNALSQQQYEEITKRIQSIIGQAMHVNLKLETFDGDFRVGSYTITVKEQE